MVLRLSLFVEGLRIRHVVRVAQVQRAHHQPQRQVQQRKGDAQQPTEARHAHPATQADDVVDVGVCSPQKVQPCHQEGTCRQEQK